MTPTISLEDLGLKFMRGAEKLDYLRKHGLQAITLSEDKSKYVLRVRLGGYKGNDVFREFSHENLCDAVEDAYVSVNLPRTARP